MDGAGGGRVPVGYLSNTTIKSDLLQFRWDTSALVKATCAIQYSFEGSIVAGKTGPRRAILNNGF